MSSKVHEKQTLAGTWNASCKPRGTRRVLVVLLPQGPVGSTISRRLDMRCTP